VLPVPRHGAEERAALPVRLRGLLLDASRTRFGSGDVSAAGQTMKRGTPEHPKTAHLMAALSIPRPYAVGILELLWHFTARYAPRGDVGR
jgi:hypothetical protein